MIHNSMNDLEYIAKLEEMIVRLRKALVNNADVLEGWNDASDADTYEASKELVLLRKEEKE